MEERTAQNDGKQKKMKNYELVFVVTNGLPRAAPSDDP